MIFSGIKDTFSILGDLEKKRIAHLSYSEKSFSLKFEMNPSLSQAILPQTQNYSIRGDHIQFNTESILDESEINS
jgi:hypothetical protein